MLVKKKLNSSVLNYTKTCVSVLNYPKICLSKKKNIYFLNSSVLNFLKTYVSKKKFNLKKIPVF